MRLETVRLLTDGFEQAAFEVRRGRGFGRLLGGRRGLRDRYPGSARRSECQGDSNAQAGGSLHDIDKKGLQAADLTTCNL